MEVSSTEIDEFLDIETKYFEQSKGTHENAGKCNIYIFVLKS